MDGKLMLQTVDYIVIVVMLLIPLGIGIFFAIKDAKRKTRVEYLLGGRRMSLWPVALSIFVTYQSAISLMGFPSEVYQHGPMIFGMYPGVVAIYLLSYCVLVPLLYPLQLTSIYEYMELRYKSKGVRLMATAMGIVQTFFYMTVALLAPGLALEAAAGIPFWMSVVIVGVTGTIYTAAGGIKSVIWTDVFQTAISFIGVYGVIIKSTYDMGGIRKAFEINKEGGRMRFDSISPDPRVRHTWWNTIIGGAFMWLTPIFNQSTVQRISSMKSLRDARLTMAINIPVNLFYGATIIIMGWCLYAYLYHIRCDPIQAGLLTNYNQLPPFYVIHAMHAVPGMTGLYMSAIFSAALSTLSSGINALATNTVEDILQKPLKSVSEKTALAITKVVVVIFGIAIIAMAYVARSAQGPVTQMSTSVVSLFGSSVVGMILLGCTVPWGNKYGAVCGALVSLAINLWLGIGAKLYGRKTLSLTPVPSDQCFNSTMEEIESHFESSTRNSTQYYTVLNKREDELNHFPDEFSPYDLSYQWYGFIGVFLCYVIGLIVSRLIIGKIKTQTDSKLIIGCLRRFWNMKNPDIVSSSVDSDLSLHEI